jgi:hypothetical protein
LAIALIVGAMLVLHGCVKDEVTVPKADIAPLQRIASDDLEQVEVSSATVGDSQWTNAGDLVGRVATTAIAKGKPVAKAAVTAAKPIGYALLEPVAFHADSNTAGEVSTGGRVTLLFAPTGDADSVEPLSVDAVLLSASVLTSGGTDYVVAVRAGDREKLLNVVARARLLVVPAS